jgi:predicted Fe-S protein YdhL (DUF1289 family)
MTGAEPGDVPSPCIGVCRLDAAQRVCVGCRRELDEIARWWGMDDAERRAVCDRLAGEGTDPRARGG